VKLSSQVSEVFESRDVRYKPIELPGKYGLHELAGFLAKDRANLVRPVALASEKETFIALLPYEDLLDMRAISDALGCDLKVIPEEKAGALFRVRREASYAPFPELVDAVLVIDPSLLQREAVLVQSGNPELVLLLENDATNRLWDDARIIPFACPPERLYAGRDSLPDDVELSFTPMRIKQRVDDTFDLPSMPDIAQDIMKLRVDPGADATKLAEIVMRDPSLAAQVISWASSPYYGYQGKVDSVETAIARVLGFELVMNLALGISIGKSLRVPEEGPLGVRQFWRQAIYCANLCEKLWRLIPIKQRPERGLIYLSGLLHNFGHLLLGHVFPPQFKLVNRTIEANPHIPIEDIEYYILGVTHEEIGGWLMQNWHMPEELIVAVLRHHQEEFWSKHAVYSNIVLVANRLLRRLHIGDVLSEDIPESTLQLLGLEADKVELALEEIAEDAGALDAMAKQLVA